MKQFQDREEDGVVIGDGCYILTSNLIDTNNYSNRPHKRPVNVIHVEVPSSKRKSILRAKAGDFSGDCTCLKYFIVIFFTFCSNWQPQIELQDAETLNENRNFLNKDIDANFKINEEIVQHLNDTYSIQRMFLNSKPTVEEIQKEWPV